MTKVVIHFRLQSPLTERQLARLSDARCVYGVLGISIEDSGAGLAVEYDATRLRPEEVETVLRGKEIPVVRV